MMLLSVGTLLPAELPADQASLFAQAQTVGVDAWNQAGHKVSQALVDAQLWVNTNPKIAGALAASIVCGCLFVLWRKNLKRRVKKDLDEAWMDGYEAAQDECDELLTEVVKEVEGAQEEGYYEGWQSAMNLVRQMQQDPVSLQDKHDQQELDQCVTALFDDLLFQLEQERGIFGLQLVVAH